MFRGGSSLLLFLGGGEGVVSSVDLADFSVSFFAPYQSFISFFFIFHFSCFVSLFFVIFVSPHYFVPRERTAT